jgi:hypothetical protein
MSGIDNFWFVMEQVRKEMTQEGATPFVGLLKRLFAELEPIMFMLMKWYDGDKSEQAFIVECVQHAVRIRHLSHSFEVHARTLLEAALELRK